MKHIAIIPARSGSKGLPDKNIRELNGKPLLAYSIAAARESGVFDEIMVSTDSERYAAIAREYGANVPFLRSAEASSDTAGSWDVVLEVLRGYRDLGRKFGTVCLLQPTSPLRAAEDIQRGYELLCAREAGAVTAVCEVDHSPLWAMALGEDLSLDSFREHSQELPRQQLETYYRINGALYIRRVLEANGVLQMVSRPEYAYVMARDRSIDIDAELDFRIAEILAPEQSAGTSGDAL